jgi:hypothetical protein
VRQALLAAAAAAFFTLGSTSAAHADTLRLCDATDRSSAAQKDRLLQVAAAVSSALQASGRELALVSRAGLQLERFGQRYSHMGLALRVPVHAGDAPWAVRQLYHDCDEGRSRVFDQGLAAFVIGAGRAELGFVSWALLPSDAEAGLLPTVRSNLAAVSMLGARYSANSHAWSTHTQNCNQWVAEMLALAWGGHQERAGDPSSRAQAQQWLKQAGYQPTVFQLAPGWMALSHAMPWLSTRDHPAEDLEALRYRVSMPQSIEAFVLQRWPGSQRVELCHDAVQAVLRRNGTPIQANDGRCVAEAGDERVALH